MNLCQALLADVEPADVVAHFQRMDPETRDSLIVFGALAVVTLLVLVWAVFMRQPKKKHHSRHHGHHHSARDASDPVAEEAAAQEFETHSHRRRRRRRRREHRPRNPTLAETGGLPPIRPDEPASPNN